MVPSMICPFVGASGSCDRALNAACHFLGTHEIVPLPIHFVTGVWARFFFLQSAGNQRFVENLAPPSLTSASSYGNEGIMPQLYAVIK